jgi:hypothetical protein
LDPVSAVEEVPGGGAAGAVAPVEPVAGEAGVSSVSAVEGISGVGPVDEVAPTGAVDEGSVVEPVAGIHDTGDETPPADAAGEPPGGGGGDGPPPDEPPPDVVVTPSAPPGTEIDEASLRNFGYTPEQAAAMQGILDSPQFAEHNLSIEVRPTSPVANELIQNGETISASQGLVHADGTPFQDGETLEAAPKAEPFKAKTINKLDVALGFRSEDVGKVGYMEPQPPSGEWANDPGAWDRYHQRYEEFVDQRTAMNNLQLPFDERAHTDDYHEWMDVMRPGQDEPTRVRIRVSVDDNGVIRMKEGMNVQGTTYQLEPRAFAGDQDTFAVRTADGRDFGGRPLGPDGTPLMRSEMTQEQWDQYRGELRVKADLFRAMDDAGLHREHGDISTWYPKTETNQEIKDVIMDRHNYDPTGQTRGEGLISFGRGRLPRVAYGNAR